MAFLTHFQALETRSTIVATSFKSIILYFAASTKLTYFLTAESVQCEASMSGHRALY